MNLKTKYWILSVLLGLIVWLGLPPPSYAANTTADLKELQVLNRLTFGPQPGDLEKVQAMGVEAYIQSQLSPNTIAEPQSLNEVLGNLETLRLSPVELTSEYRSQMQRQREQKITAEAKKAARQQTRLVMEQAMEGRLLRAIASPRQLQEVMVDFWYNHFNIFVGKGLDRVLVGSYEEQAIRPNALSKFRQLLEATAKHPAMLFYLDNWQNTAPDSRGVRGRFKGLNENYARELMELHTLGVDGGYSQQDVISLARILTGWGFSRQGIAGEGGFFFDANRHDFSDKIFLGHNIKGSGIAEGEEALDILARHPATARHISYQLAQYFVADKPPASLVDKLTQRFLETDGNIREVLNAMFHS
ncbi:MAG: hypothetical protein NVS2B14_04640 [Chamaesiphon sp.]